MSQIHVTAWRWFLLPGLMAVLALSVATAADVALYRLRAPGDQYDIEQASDLHYGSLGSRDGLWLACDRNGGASGGKIFRISSARLGQARPGEALVADEVFTIALPEGDWATFAETYQAAGPEVLEDVRRRIVSGLDADGGMKLDLEALTIGLSLAPPHEPRLFVVTEEPYSVVLELTLEAAEATSGRVRLAGLYRYRERDDEHGGDVNDGLEGLAYAGAPGQFYWAEEGTRLDRPDAHPRLFFADPRIGRASLEPGRVVVQEPISEGMTRAVRAWRKGSMQTLNALCATRDGGLLAVDRNGGWIIKVDPKTVTAQGWLNLYDLQGVNLREVLAEFPGPRRMPYISIEGVAVDEAGAIWLVDDPAMPEGFRASCLVRITGLMPVADPTSRPD